MKIKLEKKLIKLVSNKPKKNNFCNKNNWLINLTEESIPQDVINVVSLGRNFNLKTNKEMIRDAGPGFG